MVFGRIYTSKQLKG